MNDNDFKLDGNAAGGLLNELFPFEMTTAEATCGGCGTTKRFGEVMLYRHGMGAKLPALIIFGVRLTEQRF